MLNIIGTIDKPSKGDVYICGLRIKYSTKDQLLASIRLNKLGFVFQTFNLLGGYTALENVTLGMMFGPGPDRDGVRVALLACVHQAASAVAVARLRENVVPHQLGDQLAGRAHREGRGEGRAPQFVSCVDRRAVVLD